MKFKKFFLMAVELILISAVLNMHAAEAFDFNDSETESTGTDVADLDIPFYVQEPFAALQINLENLKNLIIEFTEIHNDYQDYFDYYNDIIRSFDELKSDNYYNDLNRFFLKKINIFRRRIREDYEMTPSLNVDSCFQNIMATITNLKKNVLDFREGLRPYIPVEMGN